MARATTQQLMENTMLAVFNRNGRLEWTASDLAKVMSSHAGDGKTYTNSAITQALQLSLSKGHVTRMSWGKYVLTKLLDKSTEPAPEVLEDVVAQPEPTVAPDTPAPVVDTFQAITNGLESRVNTALADVKESLEGDFQKLSKVVADAQISLITDLNKFRVDTGELLTTLVASTNDENSNYYELVNGALQTYQTRFAELLEELVKAQEISTNTAISMWKEGYKEGRKDATSESNVEIQELKDTLRSIVQRMVLGKDGSPVDIAVTTIPEPLKKK